MKTVLAFLLLTESLFAVKDAVRVREEIAYCTDSKIQKHIIEKLRSARVITDPFPHLIVENFLPEELYQHALESFPEHSLFKLQESSRQFLWTNHGCLKGSSLSLSDQAFWQAFGEVTVNHFTKPILIDKFMPFLNVKFQTKDPQELEKIKQGLDFWEHRQDGLVSYLAKTQVEPHIDDHNIFVRALLYFPEDDEHQEVGTTLYSGPPAKPSQKCPKEGEIHPVKKVPYKRNTLFVFLHSPISWHSVASHEYPEEDYLRRLFLATISLSPESIEKLYGESVPFSALDLYFLDYNLFYTEN